MSLAALSLGSMAALVKLTEARLPAQELVFWRAALSLPLVVAIVATRRHRLMVSAKAALLRRSLAGFGAMLLFFYALGQLTLAEAQILMKLQPVWVSLLSPVLVNERPGSRVLGALAAAVMGAVLVLGPSLSLGVVSLGGLAALGASVLAAFAHIELRRLGSTEHPDVVVLGFTALLLLFSGLVSIPIFELPHSGDWPLLAGIALFAMAGQFLMTSAYKAARAALVATMGYASLPVAALLDWIVFDTLPTVWTIIGGMIILGAGLALARSESAALVTKA